MSEFKYFRITLPAAVDTAVIGEGFIDNKPEKNFSTLPTSKANAVLKEQGNMRWGEIVKMLQETGAVDVQSILVTTGDRNNANIAPTQIEMTVKYGANAVVWMYDLVTDGSGQTVYGPAEMAIANSKGVTYTTATELAVVERAVASALSQNAYTDPREIFDPTLAVGVIAFANPFIDVTVAPFGAGGTHVLRMASVEGVGTFTVTQLAV